MARASSGTPKSTWTSPPGGDGGHGRGGAGSACSSWTRSGTVPTTAGYIPFCYMNPQRREQNLGVQLVGQAVSYFRPLGRDRLRLRCAPYNDRAQHFYRKHGFVKIGEETGSRVPLDIMEKYIGYQR